MGMLTAIARDVIGSLRIACMATVSYQLLTGRINTAGFCRRRGGTGTINPARVQLLVFTLAGAFYVLLEVFGGPSPHGFPKSSPALPVVLGASHLTYLASKAYSFLLRR